LRYGRERALESQVKNQRLPELMVMALATFLPLAAGADDIENSSGRADEAAVQPRHPEQAHHQHEAESEAAPQTGTGVPGQQEAQTPEEVRFRKARDGSGFGAGQDGKRGQGREGAPHRKKCDGPLCNGRGF
jgi:hypothetical protein